MHLYVSCVHCAVIIFAIQCCTQGGHILHALLMLQTNLSVTAADHFFNQILLYVCCIFIVNVAGLLFTLSLCFIKHFNGTVYHVFMWCKDTTDTQSQCSTACLLCHSPSFYVLDFSQSSVN